MANFALIYICEWPGEAEDAVGLEAVLKRHGHDVLALPVSQDEVETYQVEPERLRGCLVLNSVRGLFIPRSDAYRLLMWSPVAADFEHPAAAEWDGVVTNSRTIFRDRLGDLPLMLWPLPVDVEFYRPRRPRAEMRCEVLHIGSPSKSLGVLDLYLGPATRFDFRLYGADWAEPWYYYRLGKMVHPVLGQAHADLYARFYGGFLPRDRVPIAYSSCAINLSCHVPEHLAADQPNNRLLHSMACGCFTIEDRVPWHMEEFYDCAVFTRGGEEAEQLIEHYLAHRRERREMARRGRQRILELGYDADSFVRDLVEFASDLRTRGRGRAGH